ncbi:hypothetical protein DFH08DRAFT_806309 [Mycena albidolilacea]|uniref:Uncharacterized protein n=1 Tax=Mycena albidolilacea TaxID=1033008 RepID=A0AAD7EUE2_9AGAR|nr:hypothetical protein DFH08DRAFT_806309 [Mycena albidolilacea]
MTVHSMGQTSRSISPKNWWRRRKGSENELFLGALVKRRRSRESMSTSLFHWPKAPPNHAQELTKARSVARYGLGPCSSPINQEKVVRGAGRCAVRSTLRTGKGRAASKIHKGRYIKCGGLFKGGTPRIDVFKRTVYSRGLSEIWADGVLMGAVGNGMLHACLTHRPLQSSSMCTSIPSYRLVAIPYIYLGLCRSS